MEKATLACLAAVLVGLMLVFGCAAQAAPANGGNDSAAKVTADFGNSKNDVVVVPEKKITPSDAATEKNTAAAPAENKTAPAENKTKAVENDAASDKVYGMKFTAVKLGELGSIKMGTFGRLHLDPREGNVFEAVMLTMQNTGSMDKKIRVGFPKVETKDGDRYAYSYQKSHEASISELMPFKCDFRMDEASDDGFSAKVIFGMNRTACMIFEVKNGSSLDSMLFDAQVQDSEKTVKGAAKAGISG